MQALLDMDGVLVGFSEAVEKQFGISITEWDFDDHLPISKTMFWLSCDEDFWASLDWTHFGQEVLEMVERYFGQENICLLTSPCLTAGCMEGKLSWIRKHMPKYARRYLIGPAKAFTSAPGRLLIDDRDENVMDYRKGGNSAVLFPRPWNSLRELAKEDKGMLHLKLSLEFFTKSGRV